MSSLPQAEHSTSSKKRFILAEKFNTVVLDEADRMLDMGFITDMRKILEKTPETRETLLFSATMNQASEKLADDFLKNPVTVSVKKTDVTQNIEQTIVHYQNNNKFDTLLDLLKDKDFKRVTLVFGSSFFHFKHCVASRSCRNSRTTNFR